MSDGRDEERTEPATPRRREEARRHGRVARSADLSSAVVLLAAVLALPLLGGPLARGLAGSTAGAFERMAALGCPESDLFADLGGLFTASLAAALPLLGALAAAALAVNLLQVGFLFAPEAVAPKAERLDLGRGLARIFSARSALRGAAGLLKVAAVGAVVALSLWAERDALAALAGRPFEQALGAALGMLFVLSLRAALALVALGVLDYAAQRWQHERDLRMSRRELREELRRYEGDPRVRERRRAVQRQLALQRMVGRVPKAAVVLANPTNLAVALEYDPERMEAPVVVAKGARALARRIRELATEHGVPIVERDLAKAIYRRVEVGQPIPAELYPPVAEVLAFVFQARGMTVAA